MRLLLALPLSLPCRAAAPRPSAKTAPTPAAGAFTDRLDGYSVHLYRIAHP